jgi:hypothetical protein
VINDATQPTSNYTTATYTLCVRAFRFTARNLDAVLGAKLFLQRNDQRGAGATVSYDTSRYAQA